MRKIVLLIFLSIFQSCKTSSYKSEKTCNLSQIYKKAYSSKIIEEDPIVVLDDETLGLLSTIDTSDIKFKGLNISSVQVIPKNNIPLGKYFGDNAKNGVISIKKYYKLICRQIHRKRVFICDNKVISFEEMRENTNAKYYVIGVFDNIFEDKNTYTEVIIVTTNKTLTTFIDRNK